MGFDHTTLVAFAKSYGLFYLIALSIGVLIYTFWPSNSAKFRAAAEQVVSDEEDRPWR